MIGLLLALAIRRLACVVAAPAVVENGCPDGGRKAGFAPLGEFPANSLLGPLAGNLFSLLMGLGNYGQTIDNKQDNRSIAGDFEVRAKKFPLNGFEQGIVPWRGRAMTGLVRAPPAGPCRWVGRWL